MAWSDTDEPDPAHATYAHPTPGHGETD
jgi:hypothetical protein